MTEEAPTISPEEIVRVDKLYLKPEEAMDAVWLRLFPILRSANATDWEAVLLLGAYIKFIVLTHGYTPFEEALATLAKAINEVHYSFPHLVGTPRPQAHWNKDGILHQDFSLSESSALFRAVEALRGGEQDSVLRAPEADSVDVGAEARDGSSEGTQDRGDGAPTREDEG